MPELRIRRRHRLRQKDIEQLASGLADDLGTAVFSAGDTVDRAEGWAYDVLFVNGDLLGVVLDDRPFLTVRGLLKYRPTRRYVTVDMGAVPHIYNGADVMAPGIVDADPAIAVGDLVWVRDERNGQPLAVGEALLEGEAMKTADRGRAVRSLHHVGDPLWAYGQEEG